MKILVACEFSGIVRDAFAERGHDAWSCDLIETERPGKHYVVDCMEIFPLGWDMIIFHPPCTHLAVSGARWWIMKGENVRIQAGLFAISAFEYAPKVAMENPIGCLSTWYRKPDQIIQPWQYGHGETKATCLWLKGLPRLKPTSIVSGRLPRVHYEPPSADRAKNRSRTYSGIARAMAEQWG